MPTLPYNTQDLLAKSAAMLANISPVTVNPTGLPVLPGQNLDNPTNTPQPQNTTVTPTTLSSTGTEKVITDNTSKIDNISNTNGTITNPDTGTATYKDGTPVPIQTQRSASGTYTAMDGQKYYNLDSTPVGTDPLTEQENKMIADAQMQSDSAFAQQLTNIKNKYDVLQKQQEESNKAYQGGIAESLFASGTARYSPTVAAGVTTTAVNYGIQKISELNSQMQDEINAAQQAKNSNDQKLLDKKLAIIDDLKNKRDAEMTKVNDNLVQQSNTLRQQQETKNNAADNDIRAAILEAQKGGATSEQITAMNEALKNHNYSAAVEAGGDSLSQSTGMPGEYNFYKKDAIAHGQTPVDFNTYQNMDANRKAKVAAAGVSPTGDILSPNTTKGESAIDMDARAILEGRNTAYNIRQTMGRSNQAATYMESLRTKINQIDPNFDYVLSDSGGKSVSTTYVQKAKASINTVLPNIQTMIDISNQVDRVGIKGVDALLQKAGIQIGNEKVTNMHQLQMLVGDELGVALGGGTMSDMKLTLGLDIVDPAQSAKVFASNMAITKGLLENRRDALNSLRYKSTTVGDSGVDTGTSDHVQQTEDQAKTKVIEYGKGNTANQDAIRKMTADGVPFIKQMQILNLQ